MRPRDLDVERVSESAANSAGAVDTFERAQHHGHILLPANLRAAATTVSYPLNFTETLSYPLDLGDIYRFVPSQSGYVTLRVTGSQGVGRPSYSIYDADGRFVAFVDSQARQAYELDVAGGGGPITYSFTFRRKMSA